MRKKGNKNLAQKEKHKAWVEHSQTLEGHTEHTCSTLCFKRTKTHHVSVTKLGRPCRNKDKVPVVLSPTCELFRHGALVCDFRSEGGGDITKLLSAVRNGVGAGDRSTLCSLIHTTMEARGEKLKVRDKRWEASLTTSGEEREVLSLGLGWR